MYGAGSDSWNTAVSGSGVSIASTARNVLMPRGCTFFSTSSTVNLHVGAGEGLAVVELHAFLQLEGDGLAVGDDRPRFREARDRLQVEVVLEQSFVHLGGHLPDRSGRAWYDASVGGSGCTTMTSVPPRCGVVCWA